MNQKIAAVCLAAVLLLSAGACAKERSEPTSEAPVFTTQETACEETGATIPTQEVETEDWKNNLTQSLFDNYGVIPKYYVDLGNGMYQVYCEVGGEVVPFVTVDSATGDYHG